MSTCAHGQPEAKLYDMKDRTCPTPLPIPYLPHYVSAIPANMIQHRINSLPEHLDYTNDAASEYGAGFLVFGTE